jgi:multimeric flavodoxin WrbA
MPALLSVIDKSLKRNLNLVPLELRPMKAIAINGSPRKGGNTEILLKKALAPLAAAGWDTEFIQLGGASIRGCQACYVCFEKKNFRCSQKDEFFNQCFEKMVAADAIILGSPTYFTDVSAEMKALLDRAGLVALANGGLFRGKIGAAVVAVRRGGGTHAFDTMNHMFLMSGAIVPGSTYWNLGFGREKGEVARDDEAARNMIDLGQTIGWLGEAIHNHGAQRPVGVVRE